MHRHACNFQDFAAAIDVNIGASRNLLDGGRGRQGAVRAAKDRPQSRILRPQSPDRHPVQPRPREEAQLVIGGRRIQHPHFVTAAVFLIGKAGIAAGLVEHGHRARFPRGFPRFVNRQRLAGMIVPIIGIAADRNDNLAARQAMRRPRNRLFKPRLRRDRPRFPAWLVLVICHQEDAIDHGGERLQIPAILAIGLPNRHGDRNHPAVLDKPRPRLGEERAKIGLPLGAKLLEIEERAARMVCGQPGLELVEQRLALRRCPQQRLHAARIPISVHRILDHRQDQGAVRRPVDDLAPGNIAKHGDLVIWPRHGDPARNQPVQFIDITTERCRR
ncbi:hypothetical protein D9M73_123000 [compost metagenome]